MIGARPQLTSLTSIREAGSPKSYELSKFYQPATSSKPFGFQEVTNWIDFDSSADDTLSHISHLPNSVRYATMRETISKYVMPILRSHELTSGVRLRECDAISIGNVDASFVNRRDASQRILLAGLHRPQATLKFDAVKLWNHSASTPLKEIKSTNSEILQGSYKQLPVGLYEQKFSCEHSRSALAALQQLAHYMVLNNVEYGYLASDAHSRFLRIISSGRSNYNLQISEPVVARKAGEYIVALCYRSCLGPNLEVQITRCPLNVQTLEGPNVSPLSSYEDGALGKVRWWVAKKNLEQKYSAQFESSWKSSLKLAPSSEGDTEIVSLRRGTCSLDTQTSLNPVLILTSVDANNKLRQLASMLQYLSGCAVTSVPRFVTFAHMLYYRVLLVEAYTFEPLVVSDLTDPSIVAQLHSAMNELHVNGVMLGRFDLAAFLICRNEKKSVVRIIGLEKACLFRKVPDIARKSEHSRLDAFIDAVRECMKSPAAIAAGQTDIMN